MSEEDEQRPPGWSDDQPPPFQQSEDGWQPLPPQQPLPGHGAGQPPTPGNAWTPPPAAPKPGVIPLRPLLVGEIMTGAIDYVRREPRTVISISAMVGVVAAFVQLLVLAYTSTDLSTLPSDATEQIDPSQLVGILTSLAVLFGITAAVLSVMFLLHQPAWVGLPLGLMLVITGVLGDLVESQIKRDMGIKDMGTLLPGHGGIMDRIDAMLPSAVAGWIVLTLLA